MHAKNDKENNYAVSLSTELPDEPKTPHEEVMFVVDSTNDIVSSMYNDVGDIKRIVSKILEIVEKLKWYDDRK